MRSLFLAEIGAVTIFVALLAVRPALFAEVLIRDDSAALKGQTASAIIILGGESAYSRAAQALTIFREGIAPTILLGAEELGDFERDGRWRPKREIIRDYLAENGAGPEVFQTVESCPPLTSTYDEASCYKQYFQGSSSDFQNVVVVTSWSHTRRAGRIFERVFAGTGTRFYFIPASAADSDVAHWWRHEADVLAIYTEYLKSLYWLIKI